MSEEVLGAEWEDGQMCEESVWERQLQKTLVRTEWRKLLQWPKFSILIVLAAGPLHRELAASISLSCNKL